MTSLVGKSAVVTGGCSGIGYAVVKKFLEQGIKNVAILDICDTKNISQSLQSAYEGQKVVFIQTDVSKKDQVKSAFDKIIKLFDSIEIVVGNAGMLDEVDYERTINVNLLGMLHSTYTGIELMSKDKGGNGGTIINVASLAALELYSYVPAYTASKYGIIGLHRCFSDQYYYDKHGINFIAICPGPTDTPIMADFEKKVNFGTLEGENFKFQPPSTVAQGILDAWSLSKNGSIYVIDDGKMKEVISIKPEMAQEVVIKSD